MQTQKTLNLSYITTEIPVYSSESTQELDVSVHLVKNLTVKLGFYFRIETSLSSEEKPET